MRSYISSSALAVVLALGAGAPASALMQVDISEIGGDVSVSFAGSLDLSGSSASSSLTGPYTYGAINPSLPAFGIIDTVGLDAYDFDFDPGEAWSPFGTGAPSTVTSFTGDIFGFSRPADSPEIHQVFVASGYVFGTELSGAFTFFGETLSSLGLTAGSYIYDLPSDSISLNVSAAAVPLPAAAPLLAAGLGALGLAARRRRRQG